MDREMRKRKGERSQEEKEDYRRQDVARNMRNLRERRKNENNGNESEE